MGTADDIGPRTKNIPSPQPPNISSNACSNISQFLYLHPNHAKLIIITGLPSSGKTHRATQIHDYISHRLSHDASPNNTTSTTTSKRTVSIVPSHHASQDTPHNPSSTEPSSRLRDEIYNSSTLEKTARAEEFSAVKRGVSRDNVVIADCPNYIKGYRYQLWCEAKAASTRCCVVHVAATEAEGRGWNEGRLRGFGREGEIGEADKVEGGGGGRVGGARQGKDVRGELVPESHTAIYGDRIPEQQTSRSRSSSMDGASEREERRPQADDAITLKSLYISSPTDAKSQPQSQLRQHSTPTNGTSTDSYLPSDKPPPPTASPPYSPQTLSSLSMRYEPPSPFSRWDTPLFTVPSSDAHPPYAAIFDAIFPPPSKPTSKKALSQLPAATRTPNTASSSSTTAPPNENGDIVKPHAATLPPTTTSSSALQLLESCTLLVVRELLAAARAVGAADGDGGVVTFSIPLTPSHPSNTSHTSHTSNPTTPNADNNSVEVEISIPPGTILTQPLLQRLRRKYTQLQRGRIAHGQGYVGQHGGGVEERRGEVVRGFGRFLAGEIGGEN